MSLLDRVNEKKWVNSDTEGQRNKNRKIEKQAETQEHQLTSSFSLRPFYTECEISLVLLKIINFRSVSSVEPLNLDSYHIFCRSGKLLWFTKRVKIPTKANTDLHDGIILTNKTKIVYIKLPPHFKTPPHATDLHICWISLFSIKSKLSEALEAQSFPDSSNGRAWR